MGTVWVGISSPITQVKPKQSARIKKSPPPVDGRDFVKFNSLGVGGTDRLAVDAAAVGAAARAGHVSERRSAAVRAALAFQVERRVRVLARDILYFGSAIVYPLFRSNI